MIEVEQQIYSDNCGVETVENLIGLMKGKKEFTQIEAIELHKSLIEHGVFNEYEDVIKKVKPISLDMTSKMDICYENDDYSKRAITNSECINVDSFVMRDLVKDHSELFKQKNKKFCDSTSKSLLKQKEDFLIGDLAADR
jgi:hypothetical protein